MRISEFKTRNGTTILFRRAKSGDIPGIKSFLESCSKRTLYLRYGEIVNKPADDLDISDDESRSRISVIAFVEDSVVAMARYSLEEHSQFAEFSMIVQDKWQCHGIGRAILSFLIENAIENDIKGFEAYVMSGNHGMIKLIRHLPYDIESKLEGDSYYYRFRFDKTRS